MRPDTNYIWLGRIWLVLQVSKNHALYRVEINFVRDGSRCDQARVIHDWVGFYLWCRSAGTAMYYIDGLTQDCSNSIANALELLQSCNKPSKWASNELQSLVDINETIYAWGRISSLVQIVMNNRALLFMGLECISSVVDVSETKHALYMIGLDFDCNVGQWNQSRIWNDWDG